jgi:hypothetical protein
VVVGYGEGGEGEEAGDDVDIRDDPGSCSEGHPVTRMLWFIADLFAAPGRVRVVPVVDHDDEDGGGARAQGEVRRAGQGTLGCGMLSHSSRCAPTTGLTHWRHKRYLHRDA